jgi:predicted nucleic acid-binding protein
MHIVDSCGWLEWFSNGRLAELYGEHLKARDQLLVPVVVLYEVYKILKREIGEEKAILAAGYMKESIIVPWEEILAFKAADVALRYRLAMADALVYATALTYDCPLYTSDADLKDLALVHYLPVADTSAEAG